MNFDDLIKLLGPTIGQTGIDALTSVFKDLAEGQDAAWKKAALALVANAVEKEWPGGLKLALDALDALMNDEEPDIDWADLRVASDVLAQLQNAEADTKSAVKDYIDKLSKTLGVILAGVIKGLIAV